MRSFVAGAAGALLLVTAGLLFTSSAGGHSYRIILHGVAGTGYTAEKLDMLRGRYEVDYGYLTDFLVTSDADVPLDFVFDGKMNEPCRIRFLDPGTEVCQSKRITIPPRAAPVKLQAEAQSLFPTDYYNPFWDAPLYPAAVLIGQVNGVLAPSDPDLELERDFRLWSVVSLILALLSFVVAWRARTRSR